MLWCKKTFQQSFPDDHCRIFPTQQQLFEFLDDRKPRDTEPSRWFPFSIEFPSELDVIKCLAHRTSPSTSALFKKTTLVDQKNMPNRKRCSSQAVREDYCLLYGETPLSAQSRMFLAATIDGIQSIIQTIHPLQLHLYEIIRESTPCHLYFDVERSSDYICCQEEIDLDSLSCAGEASDDEVVVCPKAKNDILVATIQSNRIPRIYRAPVSEYEKLLRSASSIPMRLCPLTCTIVPDETRTEEVLLSELSAFIVKHYPFLKLEGNPKQNLSSIEHIAHTVFVMRSVSLNTNVCAVQKFSQHYVINLHRHIFDSNASVGEFVKHFVGYLQTRCGESLEVHRALFYHGAPVVEDLTSSLSETRSSLTLPLLPRRCIIDTAVYSRNRMMRTLGSCKLGKESVLKLESVKRNGKPINFENSSAFENLMSSLIVAHHWSSPLSADERSILHIEGQNHSGRGALVKFSRVKYTQDEASIGPPFCFSDLERANVLSAISRIEASYSNICGCECFVTSTRRLGERYAILSLGGTRYCQNVMREHKSNNVYLVMDLVKRTWVQKCFDPDCSQYRSQPKLF
ncbi:unnamed protein product [Phytomonas sp. EM1]|nr:unnamed protein product [Phytomonas sp. EM1]|eukprot:CCW63028.1 unnamed protein product [Phytomonas sp. isolate EM1]